MAALDDDALRALVERGDAPDRVFALWALASRQGAGAVTPRVVREPSAGVRRHLCAVLAGGEIELLTAMARIDPDAGVRATASRLVTRLAAGGRVPWAEVIERLDDPASHLAVLNELTDGAPRALLPRVLRLVRAEELEVALAALGAIFRMAPDAAPEAAVDALGSATEEQKRGVLAIWASHAEADAIHRALRDAPITSRLAAIAFFARSWSDLASEARDDDPRIRAAVQDACGGDLDAVPLEVLAAWIDDDSHRSWNLAHLVLERLLGGEKLTRTSGVLAYAKHTLAALEGGAVDWDDWEERTPTPELEDESDPDHPDGLGWLRRLIEMLEASHTSSE